MVGKRSDCKAFSCFGRKSSCARVLVIISAWAQRVFHDFIFQACSGGWKTSRNPTRVQSIPPLSKLAGILCRAVICPWIHKLLLQNPILPLSRCPRDGAKRQKGTNEKRKKEVWEGKAALLHHQHSCCPASRWSTECRISSLLRQTYDIDGGGISHRLKQDVDFCIKGAINSHRHEGRRIEQSLPGKLHLAPLAHFSRANFVIYKFSP